MLAKVAGGQPASLPPASPAALAAGLPKPFTAAWAQTLGAFHRVAICAQTLTHRRTAAAPPTHPTRPH